MPSLRLREVDGTSETMVALLRYLQLTCLPSDTPMGTDKGWWWVAFDGDVPVAFAGLSHSLSTPGAGYLCRAGVIPSHRGLGLQRRLLQVRERKARKLGMHSLVSDTFDNPHSANNLIKAGFRMYELQAPYGALGTCYWRKPLC